MQAAVFYAPGDVRIEEIPTRWRAPVRSSSAFTGR